MRAATVTDLALLAASELRRNPQRHNDEHRRTSRLDDSVNQHRYEDVQTADGKYILSKQKLGCRQLTPFTVRSNTVEAPCPLNTSGLFSLFKFAGVAGRSRALIESCLVSLRLWPVATMSSFSLRDTKS